jgi:hypothetical protein
MKMLQVITSKGTIKNLTEQQTKRLLEIAECQTIGEFLNSEAKYFNCQFKIIK